MKIKQKEYTRTNNFLSHAILSSSTRESTDSIINDPKWKELKDKGDYEADIVLTLNGVELDIEKFFDKLERNWESEIQLKADVESRKQAVNLFNKWKNSYLSKNSDGVKIASIKNQIDKCYNELKSVDNSIKKLSTDKNFVSRWFDKVFNGKSKESDLGTLLNALKIIEKYETAKLEDIADDFAKMSNQTITEEMLKDFRFCGLNNLDFLTSDFLNKYGLLNIYQITK